MKRLLWLADYTVKDNFGGAQQANRIIIDKAEGFEVDLVTPKEFSGTDGYDCAVLANIQKFELGQIEAVVRIPYAMYLHDFDVVNSKELAWLLAYSEANIFLSPFHLVESERLLGLQIRHEIINPPIDTNLFKEKKLKKEDTVIWAGNACPEKGIDRYISFMKSHPEKKGLVFGSGAPSVIDNLQKVKNIQFRGVVDQIKLAEEYQKAEFFFHKPELTETFGLTVIEAYLCGCRLLVNDNIGALGYNWNFQNKQEIKEKLESSPERFWSKLKEVFYG